MTCGSRRAGTGDLLAIATDHDAVLVAGEPWLALDTILPALPDRWSAIPEFKEGLATVVEAVAEGRRGALAVEPRLKA